MEAGNKDGEKHVVKKSDVMPALCELTNNADTVLYAGDPFLKNFCRLYHFLPLK